MAHLIKSQIKNLTPCFQICILYLRKTCRLMTYKLGSSLRVLLEFRQFWFQNFSYRLCFIQNKKVGYQVKGFCSFVLFHCEHKNDVIIIVRLFIKYFITYASGNGAGCRNLSNLILSIAAPTCFTVMVSGVLLQCSMF